MSEEEVLTVEQVAEWLHVSTRTIERLQIPHAKLGRARRYLRADVLAYLNEKKTA